MKTTRIFASQAVPGMVVAEDVYTFNNQMIIAAGTTLDDKMITRMKFYSVATIIVNKAYEAILNGTPRKTSADLWYNIQDNLPSAT